MNTSAPGAGALGGGLEVNAAVHPDVIAEPLFTPPGGGLLHLGQGLVNERLAPEPGVDRHDQEEVNLLQVGLNHSDGRWGVDGKAHLLAQRLDLPEKRGDGIAQLDVHANLIRTSLRKRFKQNLRLGTHQVHVEKRPRQGAHGPDQVRAERDVRHEMAVHDVQVQPISAGGVDPFSFFGEPAVIGCQQGRRNNHARRLEGEGENVE